MSVLGKPIVGKTVRLGRILLVALLSVVLLAMLFENNLIFIPSRYPAGNWKPSPDPIEDAEFTSADGTKLHGWYAPHDDPKAVVLVAHGNAGNVTHRYELLRGLNRAGASVLVFDYRGYGRSEGKPTETGVLADARAARSWLAKRAGVSERDIVLFGESLGGGVQVDLAASDGARGLILLGTFTSVPDVAAHHYPWVPVRYLLRTRLDSISKIAQYHDPLLQIHGSHDSIVPRSLAERLFEVANEPKQLLVIEGADHNDPIGRPVFAAIGEFLAKLPPSR
jgi:uncharacterized protein